ncbi:MAG TPA: Pycsar system effector family protein [Rhodothermales bacterium]|nr:Pycsar system effector family protein [Rhodothermales bacterium]
MTDEKLHDAPDVAEDEPVKASETTSGTQEVVPVYEELEEGKKKKKKKEKSLGSSRGIETMFRTSYRVNMDLSSLADTKSNIMISINGLIISIIIASISTKLDSNTLFIGPTIVLLIGCLISMIFAILAARPRINSKIITLDDVRENRANVLFFGNFSHLTPDEYVEGMVDLLQDTDKLYHNMIRDIYGLGSVLQKKFKLLRIAYTVFMAALVVGVALFIYAYMQVTPV